MNIRCKAAIGDGKGGFCIDAIHISRPEQDEVIVKLGAAGICHTDYDSLSWGSTIILGHEGAGKVVATGPEVHRFQKDDRVVFNWAMPCQNCFQCRLGNEHLCEVNSPVASGNLRENAGHPRLSSTLFKGEPVARSFNLGTLSEYAIVRESALTLITCDRLQYKAACMLSCGVMTGYGSVANVAQVEMASSVVVLGAGGVGLNVIQAARIRGATKIIAIDIQAEKLEWAIKFGATHVIHSSREDKGLANASLEVRRLTDGRGADYAFECTAVPELGAAPLAMIRNGGMAVQVSGVEEEIMVDMNLFEWDKTYINPLYGQCRPQRDLPILINLYESGELMLNELVSQTYSLTQLDEAFGDLLKGKNAKGVIVF